MTCGEKDPFVDDTVIFAGRVRLAKRARRKELEIALAGGRSAKFGEQLRMSTHDGGRDEATLRAMKRELDELASQTEEDWVQMHIFSEWSHGYMQMPRLMQEARTVINDLADWMDEVFEGRRGRSPGRKSALAKQRIAKQRHAGMAVLTDDGSTPFASETELETETDDPLTFAPKKRTPPTSFSGTPQQDQTASSSSTSLPRQYGKGASGQHTSRLDISVAAAGPRSRSVDAANGVAHQPGAPVAQDMLHGSGIALQPSPQANGFGPKPTSPRPHQRLPSPSGRGKAGSPGKAGQTISESELMRRRRLLDSHLIPSDASK